MTQTVLGVAERGHSPDLLHTHHYVLNQWLLTQENYFALLLFFSFLTLS